MSSAPAAPSTDTGLGPDIYKVAAVVVLGSIMSILDVTVVNIGLQTFTRVFHTTLTNSAWTMTGYTLALASVIPLSGWAADRFGPKRVFITALVLFTLGSALCALAWNIGALVAFRVIQGLGGGMLTPTGMTILAHAAGPQRVGRVMSLMGVPMLLGPICGPILGGWLIQSASWHWIFLINLPLGIIAVVLALLLLPNEEPHRSESFDFLGMALLCPGLALLLYGVSSVPDAGGLIAGEVLIPGAIGIVLIALFVLHSFRPEHPLIDLRLYKNRQLTLSTISMALFGISFFGIMLILPLYFLQVRGESTLSAGLLLIPQGVGAMLTMPLGGALADKFPVKRVVAPGLVFIAVSLAVFTQIDVDTSYWLIGATLFVRGLGMGLTMMPIYSGALQTLSGKTVARGTTLMNINQQIAASIGTALMSVLLTNRELDSAPATQVLGHFQNPGRVPAPTPDVLRVGIAHIADSQGFTFLVGLVMLLLVFVPVAMLPNRKGRPAAAEGGEQAAALMH